MKTALQSAATTAVDVADELRWLTNDGQSLRMSEMSTRHVFHAMKMCFNHLSTAGVPIDPVLFTKRWRIGVQSVGPYSPRWLAWHVVFFIVTIDVRGDLAPEFAPAYALIREQVVKLCGGASLPEGGKT